MHDHRDKEKTEKGRANSRSHTTFPVAKKDDCLPFFKELK